jgi:hypothetical protein
MAKSSVSSDKISSNLRRTCSGIPSKCGRNECKRSAVAVPAGKLKDLAAVLSIPQAHISLVQMPTGTREEWFPNVCNTHDDQNFRM